MAKLDWLGKRWTNYVPGQFDCSIRQFYVINREVEAAKSRMALLCLLRLGCCKDIRRLITRLVEVDIFVIEQNTETTYFQYDPHRKSEFLHDYAKAEFRDPDSHQDDNLSYHSDLTSNGERIKISPHRDKLPLTDCNVHRIYTQLSKITLPTQLIVNRVKYDTLIKQRLEENPPTDVTRFFIGEVAKLDHWLSCLTILRCFAADILLFISPLDTYTINDIYLLHELLELLEL